MHGLPREEPIRGEGWAGVLNVSAVREKGLKRPRENGADTRLGWVDDHTQDGDGALEKLSQVG